MSSTVGYILRVWLCASLLDTGFMFPSKPAMSCALSGYVDRFLPRCAVSLKQPFQPAADRHWTLLLCADMSLSRVWYSRYRRTEPRSYWWQAAVTHRREEAADMLTLETLTYRHTTFAVTSTATSTLRRSVTVNICRTNLVWVLLGNVQTDIILYPSLRSELRNYNNI